MEQPTKPTYIIVKSEDPDALAEKVGGCLYAGFIPLGSLVVQGCKLMQVMTYNINPEINVNAQVQNHY
jgi:hypothetical protein